MAAIYSDLKGKTVVVTGGAGGIGESIVRAFHAQGARVGFLDIDAERGAKLQAELGQDALFVACDLTNIPALKAAIGSVRDAFGPIDVLVNNAAHDERHATLEVTEDYWDGRMAVNLKHQFFAAQAVLPDMKALGGGSIVNFGSISWMLKQGGMPAYTSSKAAVQGLTRGLARDLGPHGIRVNTLVPGWVMTEKQLKLWVTEETKREIAKGQCIAQPLMPEHIARMALFLAADDSAMCTGQDFVVDGGWA